MPIESPKQYNMQDDSENSELGSNEIIFKEKVKTARIKAENLLNKAKESSNDEDIEKAEEALNSYRELVYKLRPESQESQEIMGINIEKNLERYNAFYTEHNIDIPDTFEQEIKEIWNNNQEKIKQSIEQEGYDDILLIPPHELKDINDKTTGEYNKTYESENFKSGGSFEGVKDTKENKTRIVLIHRKNAENMERPELNETKNKSIYELCNANTDKEKEDIDNLIKEGKPLPIDGLTLSEYMIADRIHFKETGKHLDNKSSWTWTPASYSGSRAVSSSWAPGDSRVFVYAREPGSSYSLLGRRSSRTYF